MINNIFETKFRFGELFCGPGGLGLGSKLAKVRKDDFEYAIEHAWATDYDRDSCKTYKENISPERPETVLCKDIRKLNLKTLKAISEIDGLAFGFPCNDFSVVGEQKGIEGVYGPLYSYGVNALKFFNPDWFLAENVGGLRNANEGNALSTILTKLFEAGYSVYPHLYKFDLYGVPQARQRIIIIGIRKDLDVIFKIPSYKPYENLDVSVKTAIENPPIPITAQNQELTRQSENVVERLKYIRPGENAFTADLPDHLQLNVKGAKISQIYKRLDPNKPSYTVTGSGGGGTHVYHWEENRALTNRERARIQTFPDNFEFHGSKESVRKQIGMAVPPMGVKIVFEALLKSFAKINYETTECNIEPLIQPGHRESYNLNSEKKQLILLEETSKNYKGITAK
jgi:DNA (cytosine-5)-methyltransferase 1